MIKVFLKFIASFFSKKEESIDKAWLARNVWNEPTLSKEDSLFKKKNN